MENYFLLKKEIQEIRMNIKLFLKVLRKKEIKNAIKLFKEK